MDIEILFDVYTLLFLLTVVGPPSAEVCKTAASFPLSGSPKVYRTQGGSGQRYSISSNPAIKIQEVSCVPNTPNTLVRCIGALVRPRDSEIQVVTVPENNFDGALRGGN